MGTCGHVLCDASFSDISMGTRRLSMGTTAYSDISFSFGDDTCGPYTCALRWRRCFGADDRFCR